MYARLETYLRQSHVRNDDGVEGARSVAKRLALVTVRVVLVLEDLAILLGTLPRHRRVADADVAL
jgi:hypothetical protein